MKWEFSKVENPRLIGESWEYWRNELKGKATSTQRNYLRELIRFLEYAEMTTEELYDEHLKNFQSTDRRKKRILPDKVAEYQEYLMSEKNLKSGTVANIPVSIVSFFSANELPFKMNGNAIYGESTEIPTIENEEFELILSLTGSIRFKSVIYALRDSGMRVGDLTNVKVKDIQPILEKEMDYYTWEFRPQKTRRSNLRANPVIGSEAIKWIKMWMKEREELGIDSEWLYTIVSAFKDGKEIGDKLNSDNLTSLFMQLRNKAGLREKRISIHSLRKMHTTKLGFGGVPTPWINRLQGKRGEGTQGVYTQPNPTELIEMYARGYPKLTGIETDEKTGLLEIENMRLKKQLSEQSTKTNNLEELLKELSTRIERLEQIKI